MQHLEKSGEAQGTQTRFVGLHNLILPLDHYQVISVIFQFNKLYISFPDLVIILFVILI